MPRRPIVLALLLLLATSAAPGFAGGQEPTWERSPGEGPAPNTIQVSGTLCRVNPGDQLVPGEAVVELFQENGDPFDPRVQQTYMADDEGDWSGQFVIPAGLDPGEYPLRALCRSPGGGPGLGFDYEPSSYRVLGGNGGGGDPPTSPPARLTEDDVNFAG